MAWSGTSWCGDGIEVDLRRRWTRARSVRWLRGTRALGARLVRRSRRRRSDLTRSEGAGMTVATATTAERRRWRRPWRRGAREARQRRTACPGARGDDVELIQGSEAARRWSRAAASCVARAELAV